MSHERKRFEQHEERLEIYTRDRGICQACGQFVDINSFEVAHRICSSVANYKHWGAAVIDHPLNKATTHRGRCNSSMNIGFNVIESNKLAVKIRSLYANCSD